MARRLSEESLRLLRALAREPETWRYGYELGLEVDLKAGTLYPILMRLSDRGLLQSSWESDPPRGRPRRHLYRILGGGLEILAAEQTAVHQVATAPRRSPATVRRVASARPS